MTQKEIWDNLKFKTIMIMAHDYDWRVEVPESEWTPGWRTFIYKKNGKYEYETRRPFDWPEDCKLKKAEKNDELEIMTEDDIIPALTAFGKEKGCTFSGKVNARRILEKSTKIAASPRINYKDANGNLLFKKNLAFVSLEDWVQ